MGLIPTLFLLAPLAIVPIGLVLAKHESLSSRESAFLRIARILQFPAAVAVFISFRELPGTRAAILVLPWLVLCAFVGLAALCRVFTGGLRYTSAICTTAALGYLPIGAAWLLLSRAGITIMNFGEPIILLTAVHFHFSGFGASLIAGQVTQRLTSYPKLRRLITFGSLTGMPLIAAGFTFSERLKIVAVLLFAATLVALAVGEWISSNVCSNPWTKLLLRVSGASIFAGILLASAYEISDFFGLWILSVPQMAQWHGTMNALGFTFCGLLGWVKQLQREEKVHV